MILYKKIEIVKIQKNNIENEKKITTKFKSSLKIQIEWITFLFCFETDYDIFYLDLFMYIYLKSLK